MLEKLKIENGLAQVYKMTQMFKDIQLSKDLQVEFQKNKTESTVDGVEFEF